MWTVRPTLHDRLDEPWLFQLTDYLLYQTANRRENTSTQCQVLQAVYFEGTQVHCVTFPEKIIFPLLVFCRKKKGEEIEAERIRFKKYDRSLSVFFLTVSCRQISEDSRR